MRVYISGPITGVSNFREKFSKAETELKGKQLEPINPALVDLPTSCTWFDYMKIDIEMLKLADAIYLLKGWEFSKGACMEYGFALAAGKQIMYEE